MTPNPTRDTSIAVPTSAHQVVRLSGTAAAFQMPPSPSKLPTVPRPGSARAANAATPAGSEAPAPTEAYNQGAETSTPTRSTRHDGNSTSAVTSASSAPVGVSAAAARQTASIAQERRWTATPIHGSAAYPASRLQCPCSSRSAT